MANDPSPHRVPPNDGRVRAVRQEHGGAESWPAPAQGNEPLRPEGVRVLRRRTGGPGAHPGPQEKDGLGFDHIAAQLNAEGVPTRTGKPWHGVVVNRILIR
jgi:hypothetical protein